MKEQLEMVYKIVKKLHEMRIADDLYPHEQLEMLLKDFDDQDTKELVEELFKDL